MLKGISSSTKDLYLRNCKKGFVNGIFDLVKLKKQAQLEEMQESGQV